MFKGIIQYVRSGKINDRAIQDGFVYNGLSTRIRYRYDNDWGSDRGQEFGTKLSINSTKSNNNEERISKQNENRCYKEKCYMRVRGEALSQRLESYTDYTLQLIMDIKNGLSKEKALQATEIVATTDTEAEVVKKLEKLKASTLTKTEAKK